VFLVVLVQCACDVSNCLVYHQELSKVSVGFFKGCYKNLNHRLKVSDYKSDILKRILLNLNISYAEATRVY